MKADYIALTQQSEIGSIRLSLKTEFGRDCYARGKVRAGRRKTAGLAHVARAAGIARECLLMFQRLQGCGSSASAAPVAGVRILPAATAFP
jgi:hypothetical protein